MTSLSFALLKAAGSLVLASASASTAPVAVIEDVVGNPPGIQFMDYVAPGQVIKLGLHDTIVLGYMKSCWQETITGGTVTVGPDESEVQGGNVQRSKTQCEGGKMLLTQQLADASAGGAFRAPPQKRTGPPHPEFTLYGLSPVIEVKPVGTLHIERADQPGEHYDIPLSPDRMTHGAFFDLARAGIVLTAGGIYRAKIGAREMVFKIDAGATAGPAPLIGRLVRLQPAS